MEKTPTTLLAAMRHFDIKTAARYVAAIKWPDGPFCPKCGSIKVGHIASRNRYQCKEKGCRKQFSLTTDTIMESTHLRLDQWLVAVWMIANCRNGVSSCEIARTVGCKQQSAWHLLHRVRHIFAQANDGQISGTIEADSTLVGGIVKFMSHERRQEHGRKGPYSNKTIVHALRERSTGNVRAEILPQESGKAIRELMQKHVEEGSFVYTDSHAVYRNLGDLFMHATTNHKRGQYVRGAGEIHSNGAENFFNCLRRSLKGTYIKATAEHLQPYVDEAVFRFNVRKESEWTRFDTAMRLIVGKRLTYSELTGGAIR